MKPYHLTALAAVLLVGCASPGRRTFNQLDTNHDRKITEAEFFQHVTKEGFQQLDANGDGQLTREEWLTKESAPTSRKLFSVYDHNRDGAVTAAEFANSRTKRAHLDRVFSTVDRNHDGSLTWGELHPR